MRRGGGFLLDRIGATGIETSGLRTTAGRRRQTLIFVPTIVRTPAPQQAVQQKQRDDVETSELDRSALLPSLSPNEGCGVEGASARQSDLLTKRAFRLQASRIPQRCRAFDIVD